MSARQRRLAQEQQDAAIAAALQKKLEQGRRQQPTRLAQILAPSVLLLTNDQGVQAMVVVQRQTNARFSADEMAIAQRTSTRERPQQRMYTDQELDDQFTVIPRGERNFLNLDITDAQQARAAHSIQQAVARGAYGDAKKSSRCTQQQMIG